MKVQLVTQEEMRECIDLEDIEDIGEEDSYLPISHHAQLAPIEICEYVNSLKDSAVYWFNSFYPNLAEGMSPGERQWIDRLNRIGIGYFRPLVMAILKNEKIEIARIQIFRNIEQFIFIVFRLSSAKSNYGSSEFYNFARALDRKETDLAMIATKLVERQSYTFNDDGTFRSSEFYNLLFKKFKIGSGYYGWSGLRYFLYEYELNLLSESRQEKQLDWSDLLRSDRDKISIEHIYPQTETDEWLQYFSGVDTEQRKCYGATIGNLLVLSMSINASLQNDSFQDKKKVKLNDAKEKIRNGYADGSHSEIEVSQSEVWGPEQIKARGLKLLKFMEKRWGISFKSEYELEQLLFLNQNKEAL